MDDVVNTRFDTPDDIPHGTFLSNSSTQTPAPASLGARQSPRGDSDPPDPTFGELGMQDRLNWLIWKKRKRNSRSQRLMVAKS